MGMVKERFNVVSQSIQKSMIWILEAAKRIFSPRDDDYPETGVQPFEGDIPETSQQ
ncbi:MAG: hypothetical protein AAGA46_12700 [Cyanobacteria bacterium P01_F01_bin.13]